MYAEKSAKEEAGRDLTRISDETIALREELEALKIELTKLRAENDKIIGKEKSLSRQVLALMTELESTKSETLTLTADNNTFKLKISASTDENKQNAKRDGQINLRNLNDLKLESVDLKRKREKFEEEFGRLKGEGDGQRVEIEYLRSNLIAEQALLKEIRSELSAAQLESDRLRRDFGKLQNNVDTLKQANDVLNSDGGGFKKDID